MPFIELLFLLLAIISALFVDNTNALLNAGELALIGVGLVVASYLHLFVVMMIGGWLLSKKEADVED